VLFLALAVLVAWRVVARADWESGDLITEAESALRLRKLAQAEQFARVALTVRPMDGRGYRILALVAAARGDQARCLTMIALAIKYSPRDPWARWLAAAAASAAGNQADAVRHYDRLLRVEPNVAEEFFAQLTELAESAAGRVALVQRLQEQPGWRKQLLQYFARNARHPDNVRLLFHSLGQHQPLSDTEMESYIGRFVADGDWDNAFLAWANELPAERREQLTSPVDGNFETGTRNSGAFEWQILRGIGVEAEVRMRADGTGNALRLAFFGQRNPYREVRQLLLLQPGQHYELRWQSQLEQFETARGVQWIIECADGERERLLNTDPEKGTAAWSEHKAEFDVPGNCPAQWLHVELNAVIAADSLATGVVWFDNVSATPKNRTTG
jgi:tetratricopeptide (TPR) repeat protein